MAAPLTIGLLTPALFVLVATDETAVADDGPSSPLPWADGDFDTSGPYSRVLTPGPYEIGPDEVVELTSHEDGAAIQIGIVRPVVPDNEKVPVIVMASPYYRDLSRGPHMEAHRALTTSPGDTGPGRFNVGFLIENYVPHGYAVALVAIRGTAGSGGCMDWFGPLEQADADQAVTWLGEQVWSTGDVAMIGLSWPGMAAFQVAATGNPLLKTIVPMSVWTSWQDQLVQNGTPMYFPGLATAHFLPFDVLYGWGLQHGQPDRFLGDPCPTNLQARAATARTNVDPYADPNGFFAARDYSERLLADFDGSVLAVIGFQVESTLAFMPTLEAMAARGQRVHWMLGGWGHATPDGAAADGVENPTRRWDWAEILLRWFDHELKGKDVDLGPAVHIADDQDRWRAEDTWPPAGTDLHLDLADMELVSAGTVPAYPTFGHPEIDPIRGVRLQSAPVAQDLRIAGRAHIDFEMTPSGNSGSVVVRLGDGTTGEKFGGFRVVGTMNLAYRDGGKQPQEVVPGERIPVRVETVNVDAVLPAGHRLEVIIEMHFDIPTPYSLPPSEIHQVGTLELPVTEPGAEAFYELPWETPS